MRTYIHILYKNRYTILSYFICSVSLPKDGQILNRIAFLFTYDRTSNVLRPVI